MKVQEMAEISHPNIKAALCHRSGSYRVISLKIAGFLEYVSFHQYNGVFQTLFHKDHKKVSK